MDVLEAIKHRKTVRSFNGEITKDELNTLLMAANAAPIGRAMYENMHLSVICDKDLLGMIDKNAAEFFENPDLHPLYNAPMYILVSTKLTSPTDNVGYSNCATVVENMALAATHMGIGACHIWGATIALSQNADILKKLNLPDGFTPCCGIIVGHTDEKYTEREVPLDRISVMFK